MATAALRHRPSSLEECLYVATAPRVHRAMWRTFSAAASRLESAGRMREWQDELGTDPELAAAYRAAHEAYLAERDAKDVLPTRATAGGDARVHAVDERTTGQHTRSHHARALAHTRSRCETGSMKWCPRLASMKPTAQAVAASDKALASTTSNATSAAQPCATTPGMPRAPRRLRNMSAAHARNASVTATARTHGSLRRSRAMRCRPFSD